MGADHLRHSGAPQANPEPRGHRTNAGINQGHFGPLPLSPGVLASRASE